MGGRIVPASILHKCAVRLDAGLTRVGLLNRERDHEATPRGRNQSLLPQSAHEPRVRVIAVQEVEDTEIHAGAARGERGAGVDTRVFAERVLVLLVEELL